MSKDVSAQRELLEKIIAMQEKLMPALDEKEKAGEVPSDLRDAKQKVEVWTEKVQRDFGDDVSYREEPPKLFAEKLHKHATIFEDPTEKKWIQEYMELVGKLDYDYDRPHV